MKLSRLGETHADLFFKLSRKRRLYRLVPFDAAARKEPAWPVAVAHEEHAVLAIDHHSLRAERKSAPHPPKWTRHFGKAAHWRRGRFLRSQSYLQFLTRRRVALYRQFRSHAEECVALHGRRA